METLELDRINTNIIRTYYKFSQTIYDSRPDRFLNSKLAFAELKTASRYNIKKIGDDYFIKFVDLFSGIMLPATIFEMESVKLIYESRKEVEDLRQEIGHIPQISDKLKDFISKEIDIKLHNLLDIIYNSTRDGYKFKFVLDLKDFRFNEIAFWVLYYYDKYTGRNVTLNAYQNCFLYLGNKYNVVHDAYTILRTEIPELIEEIEGYTFLMLPPSPPGYYTNYNKLLNQEYFSLVSYITEVKIAWLILNVKDVWNAADHIIKLLYNQKTYIFAYHYAFRFNHIHFHCFRSLKALHMYMWFNINRTWQKFKSLQEPSGAQIEGRYTYNFGVAYNDIGILKLQLLCSLPPPPEHSYSDDMTFPEMISTYGKMISDINFLDVLDFVRRRMIRPNIKIFIFDKLSQAYGSLDATVYSKLFPLFVCLKIDQVQETTIARTTLNLVEKPTYWDAYPTEPIAQDIFSKIEFIQVEPRFRVRNRQTTLSLTGCFGIVVTRMTTIGEYKDRKDDFKPLFDPETKNYLHKYKSSPYYEMRNNATFLAGLAKNYGPKAYLQLLLGKEFKRVITDWRLILFAIIFLKDPPLSIDRDLILTINVDSKFDYDFNKSTLKLMSIFIYLLQLEMQIPIYNYRNNKLKNSDYENAFKNIYHTTRSILFVGAIEEPLKKHLHKIFGHWNFSGIGMDAFGTNYRTKIETAFSRTSYTYVICDIDQSDDVDYEGYIDKLKFTLEFCYRRAVKYFAVKVEYTFLDTIGRVFEIMNQLDPYKGVLYLTRPLHSPQYNLECYIVYDCQAEPIIGENIRVLNPRHVVHYSSTFSYLRYNIERLPYKNYYQQLVNSEIKHVESKDVGNLLTLTVGTKLSSVYNVLSYLSNFADYIECGSTKGSNNDIYVISALASDKRVNLYKRAKDLLSIQYPIDGIRKDNLGILRDLAPREFTGQPVSATGLFNLAVKCQVSELIMMFRTLKRNNGKMNILSIGSGIYEDIIGIRHDDDYNMIDPIYVPATTKRRVTHIQDYFDWTKYRNKIDDADVILILFTLDNIFQTEQELQNFLLNTMLPYLDAYNLPNLPESLHKLFIFNLYTKDGIEIFYETYYENNNLDFTDIRTKLEVHPSGGKTFKLSYGKYEPIEGSDTAKIFERKWVVKRRNVIGIEIDTDIYNCKIDWVTPKDAHNATIVFNKQHAMSFTTLLPLLNSITPTIVTGLDTRDSIEAPVISPC